MPLILNSSELQALLEIPEVITVIEQAFLELSRGRCVIPPRFSLEVADRQGLVLYMPCYMGEGGTLGIKVVSVYTSNPKRNLPTVIAAYLLLDADTGSPLAFMDGVYITAIRTAATSAVATKYLARRDSRTLGIFGAGVQGRFHLWALLSILAFEEVRVYDLNMEKARELAGEMQERHRVPVMVAPSPQKLVEASDVIVTATTSLVPVFEGRDLRPGTHVNAIGAFTPVTREVDSDAILQSRVVVDSYQGAWTEAGDILIPLNEGIIGRDHVKAELAEVVAGEKKVRLSPEDITLFKSVGLAIEDAATAKLAYEKALQMGIGQKISL